MLKTIYKLASVILVLFLMTGCSSEKDKVARIIQAHFEDDPSLDVKLLKYWPVDDVYHAAMAKVGEDIFVAGFVNIKSKRLFKSAELTDMSKPFIIGSSWGTTLANLETNNASKLSFVYGKSAFPDFTHIEISWNCKAAERMALTDDGFFFFVHTGHGFRRCNDVWLVKQDGLRVQLRHDTASGLWNLDPNTDPNFAALTPNEKIQTLIPILKPNDFDLVKSILAEGADLNSVDKFGRNLLQQALHIEDKALALHLIHAGIKYSDILTKWHALHAAAKFDAEIVDALLMLGANPNARDLSGKTPIFDAALAGNLQTAQSLIAAGAALDTLDGAGRNVLFFPAFLGFPDFVDLMLQNGVDPSSDDNLMELASHKGDLQIMQNLFAHGAKINGKSAADRTALTTAIERDHIDVVIWLLENGADLNRKDSHGKTPLDLACKLGRAEIVQVIAKQMDGLEDQATLCAEF